MKVDLHKRDWGGSVQIAGRSVSVRGVIGFAGIVSWIALMLLRTGTAGIHTIGTTAQYCATILLFASATLSLGWKPLLSSFLAGGFMMGMTAIIGRLLGFTANTASSNVGLVLVEELAILLPPILLLWRWRKSRLWACGATDIFLLFAACGAGYGLVETANIMQNRGIDQFFLFPAIAWDGDRIHGYHPFNGHEIWAGLAGQAMGIAWIMRKRGMLALLIAASGIVFGAIDHYVLDTSSGDFLPGFLRLVSFNGYLALLLFFAGWISTALTDTYVIYKAFPKDLRDILKQPIWAKDGITSLLELRALAFANFQLEQSNEKEQPEIAEVCITLTDRLASRISS